MNLSVCSTTLHEAAGDTSRFPDDLRALICDAVAMISLADMEVILGKHESDSESFDGRIEQNLRSASKTIELKANHPISTKTRFNNDLVIGSDGNLVCLEIEKGQTSRFEFDILKMQAFASRHRLEQPEAKIFGAFLVPAGNIVARHISGNARESSYRYLCRLLQLVAQIDPSLLDDILIVGYGISTMDEQVTQRKLRKMKKMPLNAEKKNLGNMIVSEDGLLPKEMIWDTMSGYPIELVMEFRDRLNAKCIGLKEKLNRNNRCLGYARVGRSDAFYIYVQKKRMLIDVRVSPDRSDELRRKGFEVQYRNNFQGRAGWLTGLLVPHDTASLDVIVDLAVEALHG